MLTQQKKAKAKAKKKKLWQNNEREINNRKVKQNEERERKKIAEIMKLKTAALDRKWNYAN